MLVGTTGVSRALTFVVPRPSASSRSLNLCISSCNLPDLFLSDRRSVASQSGALWSVASNVSLRNFNCALRFSMCLSKS